MNSQISTANYEENNVGARIVALSIFVGKEDLTIWEEANMYMYIHIIQNEICQ